MGHAGRSPLLTALDAFGSQSLRPHKPGVAFAGAFPTRKLAF